MIRTTLTSKGQLTIPKAVRQQLALREGDQFEVSVVDDEIRLRPLRRYRAAQLRDLLRGSRIPFAGFEQEKAALAQALAERERRG